jgi:small GTP-binding protein
MTNEEEIKRLEEELQNTKYNKHTQFHIGQLKARIARLKEDASRKSGGSRGVGYSIRKSGDATVLLVGFPSVGKSTLLNRITNAESKVAEYEFTTLDVIPGVMEYNGAKIQILDIPGIIEGASSGKGRGREVLSVMRNADLIVIMADPGRTESADILEHELGNAGFRLNRRPPRIMIQRKLTGGVALSSTVRLTKLNREIVRSVLNEFKVSNAEVIVREDAGVDELIDALMKNRIYVPYVRVLNKVDKAPEELVQKLRSRGWITISAENGTNIESLRRVIWEKLGLMRVYMKRIGREPDTEQPLIMREGATVQDVADSIHREAFASLAFARIWGSSARFPGQKVGTDRTLRDKDVVELHTD